MVMSSNEPGHAPMDEPGHTPKDVLQWLDDARTGGVYRVSRGDTSFVSWADVRGDVSAVAAHLSRCGIGPGDRVGIRAENTYPWLVLDLALLGIGAVPVAFPVSDFVGRSNAEISQRYGLVAIFAATGSRSVGDDAVYPLESLLELPALAPRANPPAPEGRRLPSSDSKYFTLAFSSGTAGRVKCLLMAWPGVRRLIEITSARYAPSSTDRIMIALPLSTFQQRFLCYLAIRNACSVILTTARHYHYALRAAAPTVLLGPPNFYEFAATRFANESSVRRHMRRAVAGMSAVLPGHQTRMRWRRMIFQSYHDMFGGNARVMLVGSAPVRPDMLKFFATAGFELYQIYGMTETGYITWNYHRSSQMGSVGRETYPGTVTLGDDGEVLIKHPWHICCGYEGETAVDVAAVFRGDNVIATGDLGQFAGEYLYLKGRKKNLLVTAGGEKVPVEELEQELAGVTGVNQVALIDAPGQRGFAAVVWYHGDEGAIRSALRPAIEKVSRRLGVGSEIRQLALIEGELTPDSPLLNRNLKLDRAAVQTVAKDRLSTIG